MRAMKLLAGIGLATVLAGCATGLSEDVSVAEYCANPDVANEGV